MAKGVQRLKFNNKLNADNTTIKTPKEKTNEN